MKYSKKIEVLVVGIFLLLSISPSSAQQVGNDNQQQTMSIDVKDHDIQDVIRMISKGYNLSIIIDKEIQGKVTLHLSNVPIMEGLRSLAESHGLEVVKEGSVYRIRKAVEKEKSNISYFNGLLTVDVQNVDVIEFLKELSAKTALSIVPDAKVSGKITGRLYKVDVHDGLLALMEANGFNVVKRRNIYQIMSGETGSQPSDLRFRRPSGTGSRPGFFVNYSNGRVTIDVSNGDLEDILKAITEQGDVQIVTYGSVKTEINAKLNNVPLQEALTLLLGGTRFTFVKKDDIILIGDRNTATQSGSALSKSELVHLNHIKADEVPKILPKDIPPNNVKVVKEQNALLVSGTSEDIVNFRQFLETIDIPTPQVRIDALVVEFKENLNKEFGLNYWTKASLSEKPYTKTPAPSTYYRRAGTDEFEIGTDGVTIKNIFQGTFPEAWIKKIPDDFFLVLRWLEQQGKAEVHAQPSILTLNGYKASISVGETQYFKIVTGVGENSPYTTSKFQPIKFGVKLDITPWISKGGQITAEISPELSNSEGNNAEGYPNVSTRTLTTTVRLNDGETLVLGGLIKNQTSEDIKKVPFLGDIPFLGALFRRTAKTRIKSDLVIFITPHIINKEEAVDLDFELDDMRKRNRGIFERGIFNPLNYFKPTKKNISKNNISTDTLLIPLQDSTQIGSKTQNPKNENKGEAVPDTTNATKK